MAATKAKYFINEMTDWKRTIAFYMDEVIELTAKLAELIERNSIPSLAAKVEKQQDKLNAVSKKIHRLQAKFQQQETMLITDSTLLDDSRVTTETENYQKELRHMLHDTEKEFVGVKNDCRIFLAAIYNK